jgi:nitrile hydratase subunit beta
MTNSHPEFPPPRFGVGDKVVVKNGPPETHCRTPYYLRGVNGQIIELIGRYQNPSLLALHKPGLPKLWLYRVRFDQYKIWEQYNGANSDSVVADLYEHWLVPVKEHSNVSP